MAEEFTCVVDEQYRSACKDLPKYPGSRYCVLHEPAEEKNKEEFEEAKKSKLARKDYDFGGTVFPKGTSDFKGLEFDNANFAGATFLGKADFSGANFSGALTWFPEAQFSGEITNFTGAQFSSEETHFSGAHFSGQKTWFDGAKFSGRTTTFGERYGSPKFSGAQFSGRFTSFLSTEFGSEETDFSGAQFSDESTHFSGTHFSGETTYFSGAHFSGEMTDFGGEIFGSSAVFSSGKRTDFSGANFSGEMTYFSGAQFGSEETDFTGVQFSGGLTSFAEAQFSGGRTDFEGVRFSSAETTFQEVSFTTEVVFTGATFKDRVVFWGSKGNLVFEPRAWARFNRCHIEKPEQFTFNTMFLHPGWFCNVDVREVDFTDVKWYGMRGNQGTLDQEIMALKKREVESPYTLLAQACRRLSANAEENREYPLANAFHYWSMDALRKEGWRSVGLIGTLYWALSGYGVRAARAFWALVVIWAAFATLYVLVDPSEFKDFGQGIGYLWQTAVYSLLALARLNPEPRPEEPGLFQFLVGLEGILGPLQVALLALAIRRKVMR